MEPIDSAHIEVVVRGVLQVLLLTASAFFSGSEVALFSLSRLDLEKLQRDRDPNAGLLFRLIEQPRRLIISILCGNELINIAAAANMAGLLILLVGVDDAALFNLLIMVPLLLLFGEVTPKTIAISNPIAVSARVVAPGMTFWVNVVTPLRWLIHLASDKLTTRLVGEDKVPESLLQPDEFRVLAQDLERSGELRLEERLLVDALLETGTKEVIEIMAPRTRTVFLHVDASVPEAVALVRETRTARVPVFRRHRDDLVGFVHAEDLMALAIDGEDLSNLKLVDLLHPIVVVPPTKRVDELLTFFRDHSAQAAMVVDEFGGVQGMVSIQTVIDFMFAPVSGKSNLTARYATSEPGRFEVPGEMKLTQFNDLTSLGISDPRMTTVAGVVYRHLDRLAVEGDTIVIDGIQFEVLAMDEHRIARVAAGRSARGKEVGS